METFNITKIMEQYAPNTDELSKVLFPHIKYPKQAFDRVLKGEANLDSEQITRLASYLGILVSDLFNLKDDWKGSYDTTKKCLIFTKGEYKINLNYNGSFITVYKDNKVIHQEVKSRADSMTFEDFIRYINKFIV